jgi:glycosyltransferase involved in cell wall biosynthesis
MIKIKLKKCIVTGDYKQIIITIRDAKLGISFNWGDLMKTNVLAFCFKTIPSAVIGVIKPLEKMEQKQILNFKYKETRNITEQDIELADVIICIRGAEEIEVHIVDRCKDQGKYLINYLDDDLLNINTLSNSYNKSYFEKENVRNNLKLIMKKSNCLWTTNNKIAVNYSSFFDKVIVTNAPALLLNAKNTEISQINNKNFITIGFAGGIDHRAFFEKILMRPFRNIFVEYKDKIKIEIFGFMPYYMHNLPLSYYEYKEDYNQYKSFMLSRKWDIALAPLENTSFHSCKYFNKFLEYGSIKAAGIYSNVEPYTLIVQNNNNGLLVDNNTKDWLNAIISLINNEQKRMDIINNAYLLLKDKFNVDKIASDIINAIPELYQYKAISQ